MPPLDPDAVLAALDPEQRAVAQALSGPVCVLAGAGTGKTRAITHRIAYGVHAGVYTPQTVLAVTFTARAAGEMRGRLRALGVGGVQARTFHAAALRQLRYFWPRVVGGEVPRITDRKVPILAEAVGRLRLAPGPTGLRDLAAEVEWAKVTRTSPEDYPAAAQRAGRTPPLDLDAATMGRVFAGYEEAKRTKGLIDFEDVLLLTVAALEDRRDVAEEVRSAYRHFVVDEYQDVNPLQQRLLELWLGDRDALCVVGDASQTIYSFTGASSSYLLDFPRRWPGAEVVRLVRDYRSTPQVVALANRVLEKAHGPSAAARLELVAQRPTGPEPAFVGYSDEQAEAAGVAAAAAALLAGGVAPSEIAVLYRINAQSEAYEDALTAVGIPYVLRGGERFFERPEVKQAVLLLRGAARASEAAGAAVPGEVGDVLAATGWDPAVPPTGGAARERWESLAALLRLAEDFVSSRPEATLRALVGELDERAASPARPHSRGGHARLVACRQGAGVGRGLPRRPGRRDGPHRPCPDRRGGRGGAPAALRRRHARPRAPVAVVGVGAQPWGLAQPPAVALPRRAAARGDSGRPGGRRTPGERAAKGRSRGRLEEHCQTCRRLLTTAAQRKRGRCDDCPPDYDEAFYDLLKGWRLARSRADSVPAYVVFTDATLEAIAVRKPSTRAELAQISGVGAMKLERYSAAVLALVGGSDVESALDLVPAGATTDEAASDTAG